MKACDIMHPEDLKAISVLKKIPFVDDMCRTTLELAYERIYRGENLGMMVKVDTSYMPDLYRDLKEVTGIIGMKMPELFVYNDPVMNAFTFGETNPYICVSSSLFVKMYRE